MHIDWNWIKQRPQYIALGLSGEFEVDVFQIKKIAPKCLSGYRRTDETGFLGKIGTVFLFPKQYRIRLVQFINRVLFNIFINCGEYDYIWIPYPEFIIYIPNGIRGNIVYDCMDDYAGLAPRDSAAWLRQAEKLLVSRAYAIFASSAALCNKLIAQGADANKVTLLRNGYHAGEHSRSNRSISEPVIKSNYSIAYYGTIASWFDSDSIGYAAARNTNVSFIVFGPIEKGAHLDDCIEYGGVLKHEELELDAASRDCLIMPFIVNKAIEAVDPVKLYEYIDFGKCIISCRYNEIERFEPFVYFYENAAELSHLVQSLAEFGFPPKYSSDQAEAFLEKASWDSRLEVVRSRLKRRKKCQD